MSERSDGGVSGLLRDLEALRARKAAQAEAARAAAETAKSAAAPEAAPSVVKAVEVTPSAAPVIESPTSAVTELPIKDHTSPSEMQPEVSSMRPEVETGEREIVDSAAPLDTAAVEAVRAEVKKTAFETGLQDMAEAFAMMFGEEMEELGLGQQLDRLKGQLDDEAQELAAEMIYAHASYADKALAIVVKISEQVKLNTRSRAFAALAQLVPLLAIGYGAWRGRRFQVVNHELVESTLNNTDQLMYRAGVAAGLREGYTAINSVRQQRGFRALVERMLKGIAKRGVERIVDPLVEDRSVPPAAAPEERSKDV